MRAAWTLNTQGRTCTQGREIRRTRGQATTSEGRQAASVRYLDHAARCRECCAARDGGTLAATVEEIITRWQH